MASQTPKSPAPHAPKKERSENTLKNKSTFLYAGTIVILVITIVAFVFLPSGNVGPGGAGGNLVFGSYAGKSIGIAQGGYFSRQVSLVNDALKQQGINDQNYQLYAYQVYRQAFERTVLHYGVLDAVKKAGGHVTENYVDEKMASNEAFQDNGQFSPRLYRDMANSQKLALRDNLREEALSSLYTDYLYGQEPSSSELAFVKNMAKEMRTIEYAAFPLTGYPDSEVAAWLSANTPLFRHLKLARVSVATGQADAEKLLKQVKAGTLAFEDAAKSHSSDSYADKGGSMGPHYFYEIEGDLEKKTDAEQLAALKTGEYSPVLKTLSGSWAFYKAEDNTVAADLKDPVVLKDARAYMVRYERGKLEDWVSAQAAVIAKGPSADFEKACKKAGYEVKTTGPFPLNYGDIDFTAYGQRIPLLQRINSSSAAELSQASSNEAFLTAAFSLAPGAVSGPIVLGDNILVVKVKEESAATDDQLASLGLYYPYFYQQKNSYELADVFLKSPLLKDNFMQVFFKHFTPNNKS
jgi:hypothetical protein